MGAARTPRQMKFDTSSEVETPTCPDSPARVAEGRGAKSLRVAQAKLRGFARIPTHAVGVISEKRSYPRAQLRLPVRVKRVAGHREVALPTLLTKNISSSGVYFLCPELIEPGTPIELEVVLVDRPRARGSVRMTTAACVVRVEPAEKPGWHGLAASFDDITFQRDDPIPPRFRGS